MAVNNIPLMTPQQLASQGRHPVLPFALTLSINGEAHSILARKILRLLPGKRWVVLAEWNQQRVVAKIYWQQPKIWQRELAAARALHKAQITTPPLLGWGHTPCKAAQFILFAYIPDAVELTALNSLTPLTLQQLVILKQVIACIAKLHQAGLLQQDIHLNNFLWANETIYVIDGDSIKIQSGELSSKKSQKNLALFFAQFYPMHDSMLMELLSNCKTPTLPHKWGREKHKSLLREIVKQRRWRQSYYLAKTLRDCTEFIARHHWTEFLVCRRDDYANEMLPLLKNPDFYMLKGFSLKEGRSATVVSCHVNHKKVVIKRYNIKNPWHKLKRMLQSSRAMKSWLNAHRLMLIGIATAKPISLIEKRWGPLRTRAYFVTEFIAAETIKKRLATLQAQQDDKAITALLEQLRKLFQLMYKFRLIHRDMKASNFLIDKENTISLIDLDALYQYPWRLGFKSLFRRDLSRFMQNWYDAPAMQQQLMTSLAEFLL